MADKLTKKTEKMQKTKVTTATNIPMKIASQYKVKKPLPYSKSNMVITFSVKLCYIYGWSVYYI